MGLTDGPNDVQDGARPQELELDGERDHLGRRHQQRVRRAAAPARRPARREIWEIKNGSGGWFHPFHIHLVDFKILSRNGKPPFAWEQGPKDVVYVGENETVKVAMKMAGPDAAGSVANQAAKDCYDAEAARLTAAYGGIADRAADGPLHDALPQPRPRGPRHDGPVLGRRPGRAGQRGHAAHRRPAPPASTPRPRSGGPASTRAGPTPTASRASRQAGVDVDRPRPAAPPRAAPRGPLPLRGPPCPSRRPPPRRSRSAPGWCTSSTSRTTGGSGSRTGCSSSGRGSCRRCSPPCS